MINYNLSPPLQLIVGESQAVNINLKDKVKKENCYWKNSGKNSFLARIK
jgi:hypothetical protein